MKILPYEQFTIHTQLDPAEVKRRVSSVTFTQMVKPNRPTRLIDTRYLGMILKESFDIQPLGLFSPATRIHGQLTGHRDRTTIDFTVTADIGLFMLTGLLLTISLGLLIAVVTEIAKTLFTSGNIASIAGALPCTLIASAGIMGVFVLIMKVETYKTERYFRWLLDDQTSIR